MDATRYNSLQVARNRRFGAMFQVQASYSLSKCVDTGSATNAQEGSFGVVDPYDELLDPVPCAFNRSQNRVVNALYSLPFRRNKFVSERRLAGRATGSTGLPVNVADRFDQTLGGAAAACPNYSGAAGCHPYEILSKPIAVPAIQDFNPACYTLQALGTEGNVGRNSIYGPGFFTVDFSIITRTKITENLDSEFRSEFFNFLNPANFFQANQFVFTAPTPGQITSRPTPPSHIQFPIKFLSRLPH